MPVGIAGQSLRFFVEYKQKKRKQDKSNSLIQNSPHSLSSPKASKVKCITVQWLFAKQRLSPKLGNNANEKKLVPFQIIDHKEENQEHPKKLFF